MMEDLITIGLIGFVISRWVKEIRLRPAKTKAQRTLGNPNTAKTEKQKLNIVYQFSDTEIVKESTVFTPVDQYCNSQPNPYDALYENDCFWYFYTNDPHKPPF